jgi:hypothetical protein
MARACIRSRIATLPAKTFHLRQSLCAHCEFERGGVALTPFCPRANNDLSRVQRFYDGNWRACRDGIGCAAANDWEANRAATSTCDSREARALVLIHSFQQAKRFVKVLIGFTLLALGILMIATPGPGWLTIMLALGILAAEFVWVRRLLDRLNEQGVRIRDSVMPREKPDNA